MSRPRIISVQTYDGDPNEIIVQLDNGSVILLELPPPLRGSPAPAGAGRLSKPRTNGRQVYWQEGPSLTLEEILELLEDEKDIPDKTENGGNE